MMRCDFCNQQPGQWAYPCQDFEMPLHGSLSHGAWCACEDCASLIEQHAYNALLDRAIAALAPHDALIWGLLAETYQLFAAHRTGPRRPARLEVN